MVRRKDFSRNSVNKKKRMSSRLHEKPWSKLTPMQMRRREDSLKILREARNSDKKSLSRLVREHNEKFSHRKVSVNGVINNTRAFTKKGRRWVANETDSISRRADIGEKGNGISIETTDFNEASKIGRYQWAVSVYLNNGNTKFLEKFKGVKVRDSNGKLHTLETDLEKVREINAKAKEGERPPVY